MTVVNGYITLAALKAELRETRTVDDASYERAVEAASRRIDAYCGRQFWRTPTAEVREFRAATRYWVRTGDYADTTSMTVEISDPAGAWVSLAAGVWQPEPFVRINGHPYTAIVSASGLVGFPVSGRRARVRVTARWGWEAIPKPVEQACQILAIAYYKSRDMSGGVAGFEGDSTRLDALTVQAEALLAEFRDPTTAVSLPVPTPAD